MASFRDEFRTLHADYSPVPFYWWSGEALSRERIAWQLDQLKAKGVLQTLISYPHDIRNKTVEGDPKIFSPEWWDLFRWFLAECRQRGMTTGIQDYTIVVPTLQEIGRATPEMQGGQLACVAQKITGPGEVRLEVEKNSHVVGVWAYPVKEDRSAAVAEAIELTDLIREDALAWTAPQGEWLVALVFARLNPFDPLHPDSGRLAIEKLYAPFERECPGEVGQTLKIFFQDELDFGARMPFWSNRLLEAFSKKKGYDLRPWLPALWHDLGRKSEKVRMDYADMVTGAMEDSYFKPIFAWHEARGTLFGNDNCGRGDIAFGRQHYGDYFRTMRWYSAPGADDPSIEKPRAFKGLKVNSSIAHLYQRPRVWIEGFHSSGWGVTPAELLAALNEDFVYGATIVNLHGLYYSTYGGWWEWASPDFHFRQPYWENFRGLNDYFTRLAWLLSQGVHVCDVAILSPMASLDAEPIGAAVPHWEDRDIRDEKNLQSSAEETAFSLGKFLFDRACDFDFIDFESLERAQVPKGKLETGAAAYRALVLPALKAIHFSSLKKTLDFVHGGGVVIAYGCLPDASDLAGRADPEIHRVLDEIFGSVESSRTSVKVHGSGGKGIYIHRGFADVLLHLDESIRRDVVTSVAPLQVLHRRIEQQDLYFVFNPATTPQSADVQFRATGNVEELNAWNGELEATTPESRAVDSTTLRLSLGAREGQLFAFDGKPLAKPDSKRMPTLANNGGTEQLSLGDEWQFSLQPTLDNRFGDFRLPATNEFIGAEARQFRCAEELQEDVDWYRADLDDSGWRQTTYSFGPRFLSLGPLPPHSDFVALEKNLILGGEQSGDWQPYEFSLRWGIERDPFLIDRMSGPHGLKNYVPDEFFDFYDPTPGTTWYLRAEVMADKDGAVPLFTGGRCAYRVWVNGESVLEQVEALPPGHYPPWGLPHHESTPREAQVFLLRGTNHLLVRLTQPQGQRTRAYIAFQPPPQQKDFLGLRWFTETQVPRPTAPASAERRAVWLRFLTPPGVEEIEFIARGPVRVWSNGSELAVSALKTLGDGSISYRATVSQTSEAPVMAAIRVEAPLEFSAGDVLPEPVRFKCGTGLLRLGDWSDQGLATYSGIGRYQKKLELSELRSDRKLILDLGDVAATAEVRINGQVAGELVAHPWQLDITRLVRIGANEITVSVANTLANHYSVGIPTPYAFPAQTRSGLMGPVRLLLK